MLNRIPPHLQIRKTHLTSAVRFETDLDARSYADATSERYSHVTCIVLDKNNFTLYQSPGSDSGWFEHPIPIEYSRRAQRLIDKRRSKPWYPILLFCDIFVGWLDSGVPQERG
ncbi:hypothetical protein SV7mr_26920 [Stieleria bergensis]|uniref:Uncharacterized protein n=2 Tax=Stieleria bergensis TaxID=2528025 RepID=A0A517SVM2_9BACT|nr:hypothetical protein SV7mr_26920 [Planctomycetes bacterium SV_7m_r]